VPSDTQQVSCLVRESLCNSLVESLGGLLPVPSDTQQVSCFMKESPCKSLGESLGELLPVPSFSLYQAVLRELILGVILVK
jgi:hypothetical protein